MKSILKPIFWIVVGGIITPPVEFYSNHLINEYRTRYYFGDTKIVSKFNINSWAFFIDPKPSLLISYAKNHYQPKELEVSYEFIAKSLKNEEVQFYLTEDLDAKFPASWTKEDTKKEIKIDENEFDVNALLSLKPGQIIRIKYVVNYKIPYLDFERFNFDIDNLSDEIKPILSFKMVFPNDLTLDLGVTNKISLREKVNEAYVIGINNFQKCHEEMSKKTIIKHKVTQPHVCKSAGLSEGMNPIRGSFPSENLLIP